MAASGAHGGMCGCRSTTMVYVPDHSAQPSRRWVAAAGLAVGSAAIGALHILDPDEENRPAAAVIGIFVVLGFTWIAVRDWRGRHEQRADTRSGLRRLLDLVVGSTIGIALVVAVQIYADETAILVLLLVIFFLCLGAAIVHDSRPNKRAGR